MTHSIRNDANHQERKDLLKRFLPLLAIILIAAMFPLTASAWFCRDGAPDTPENQQNGKCTLTPPPTPTHVPKPRHTPTPESTPVPTVEPTVAPTPAPTEVPPPAPTTAPTTVPVVPQSVPQPPAGSLVAMCHYEPTTGNFETRHVQPWLVAERLELGDTLMPDAGVCAQPTEVPVATVTPVPAATPAPTVEVQPATPEPTPAPTVAPTVAPTPEPMIGEPESIPEPEIQTPAALPVTGGDDGCSYFGTCLP